MAKKKRGRAFFPSQSKSCIIAASGLGKINYKDVEVLKKFITEKGKIIPSRLSGVSTRNQKYLAAAIKRARNCALLHFSDSNFDPFLDEERVTVLDNF